ncbi:MAG TPA: D-2-hydroxyacid dehydrogenase [Alphaproteobacteria bacterium]|nr:D-2-hydroxyacid dehydrogenase [Alphaproteobacteria bacterium]
MPILIYITTNLDLIARLQTAFPDQEFIAVDTAEGLARHIGEAAVLIISNGLYTPGNAKIIREKGKKLQWIQFTTSGVDIAIASGLPDGVPVANAAGTNANTIAEHAMALLLTLTRQMPQAIAARAEKTWSRRAMVSGMVSLDGLTMTLVGVGAIGREIARKAKAFDMNVIAITRSTEPVPDVDELRPRARLMETMAITDVLCIAAGYDASTHGMIDAACIATLKPGAIVVNIARGQIIDERALVAALREGKLYGLGTDVAEIEPPYPSSELWTLPNVAMTPHAAGGGGAKVGKLTDLVSANIRAWRDGKALPTQVHNLSPAVPAE